MTNHRAILIAGPTASGKSALALGLARQHRGVVINADSMQVYRELRILTARPMDEDLRQAPHALYGYVSGHEPYSVARWLGDVKAIIEDCRRTGMTPIITGGTGLYFKALLEGLSPIPAVSDAVRMHWRSEAQRLGAAALHVLLRQRDPATAERLAPTDTQRLTRAHEVLDATGRGLVDWQRERGAAVVDEAGTLRLVVAPARAVLYARAEARLDAMLAAGALEEATALSAAGLAEDAPLMRALGVRPLIAAAKGHMSVDAALAEAKSETRRYVKRQITWLKRHMIAWNWHI